MFLLSLLILISCCSEAGSSDTEDHSTLILEGTIEYVFDYGGSPYTWTNAFSHTDGNKYVLECKSDGTALAEDNDNNGDIYICITEPPASSFSSATDFPDLNSTNPDAEVLSAEMEIYNSSNVDIGDIDDGDYSELKTDADLNKAKAYMFMYSTEETTLDGTVDFGDGDPSPDLTYDNVKLNKGWTKVITTPVLGGAVIFTNGTINNAVWFSLED